MEHQNSALASTGAASPLFSGLVGGVWAPAREAPSRHNGHQAPALQSNPHSATARPHAHAAKEASLYKTELCRSHSETGHCRYGQKCQFAHGEAELRPVVRHRKYKTERCKNFARNGVCPYGPRCRFIHHEDEARTPTPHDGRSPAFGSAQVATSHDLQGPYSLNANQDPALSPFAHAAHAADSLVTGLSGLSLGNPATPFAPAAGDRADDHSTNGHTRNGSGRHADQQDHDTHPGRGFTVLSAYARPFVTSVPQRPPPVHVVGLNSRSLSGSALGTPSSRSLGGFSDDDARLHSSDVFDTFPTSTSSASDSTVLTEGSVFAVMPSHISNGAVATFMHTTSLGSYSTTPKERRRSRHGPDDTGLTPQRHDHQSPGSGTGNSSFASPGVDASPDVADCSSDTSPPKRRIRRGGRRRTAAAAAAAGAVAAVLASDSDSDTEALLGRQLCMPDVQEEQESGEPLATSQSLDCIASAKSREERARRKRRGRRSRRGDDSARSQDSNQSTPPKHDNRHIAPQSRRHHSIDFHNQGARALEAGPRKTAQGTWVSGAASSGVPRSPSSASSAASAAQRKRLPIFAALSPEQLRRDTDYLSTFAALSPERNRTN